MDNCISLTTECLIKNPQIGLLLIGLFSLLLTLLGIVVTLGIIKKQIKSTRLDAIEQNNNSRDIAKKTKAMDAILNHETDNIHAESFGVLTKYKKLNGVKSIARLAEKTPTDDEIKSYEASMKSITDPSKSEEMEKQLSTMIKKRERTQSEFEAVMRLLNYYENIAISIRKNIMCEEIIRNAKFTIYLKIFKNSYPLITELRVGNSRTLFSEMVWLFKRWKKAGYKGKLPELN